MAVVRPGLVAIGLAIAFVGAGLGGSLVLLPSGTNETVSSTITLGVLPGAPSNWTINLTQNSGSSLVVSWTTTAAANVTLWGLGACPSGTGLCPVSPAIESWTTAATGRWSTSGPLGPGLLVSVTDAAGRSISFSGTATEGYPTKGTTSLPVETLEIAAAAVLLLIGGVAVFLGLFLRSGVYGRNPAPRTSPYPRIDDDELDDDAPDGRTLDDEDDGRSP